ncbi:VWA domain-containing protein [candidate division KSB1 bacterium]|nr:MAG: VWA domain-containing protein [candidate division KSB1 bacterium]
MNAAVLGGSLLVSNLRLTLTNSIWFYLLTALLLVLAAWAVYRFTLPPVSRFRRTVLWILRGCALALLALLLFEPVLSYLKKLVKPPVVAVLIDQSASIGSNVQNGSREQAIRQLLSSSVLKDLGRRTALEYRTFADSLFDMSADSLASIGFHGVGTDISGALARTQKTLTDKNLSAIVLISDGAYNGGENPARIAGLSPVPIYAIAVGDTFGQADAVLSEILTNEIAYAGSRIPLDVRVHARGLAGKSSTLRLLEANGSEIAREPVRFAGDDVDVSVPLNFNAAQTGDQRVTVVLDSVAGEALSENNRRSVIIRVLDRKSRVFLIAGGPGADFTELRQTLESDTTIEVTAVVEIGGGKYVYGSTEPAQEDLAKASLIVLCDYPSRGSSQVLIDRIKLATAERRIPVMFFAGSRMVGTRLNTLSEILPIQSPRQALAAERVVTRSAAAHPALEGSVPLPAVWSDLPPVSGGIGNFTVAAGTQVVVKLSREALGIPEDEPGVVVWEMGGRRGAAVLCWETSRWKLQLAGGQSAAFYDQMISRLRAWLVAPVEERRVKIRTTKKLYSGGERVRFTAQVYGADMAPRDDAKIVLQSLSGSRTEIVAMRNRGSGRYEGELSPWTVGDYRFSGIALVGEDTLGSDRGLFTVEPFNIELLDTRARHDVLRQTADASHGSFAPAAQADSLLARLSFDSKTVASRSEIPLWRRGPMIWILIVLLTIEWTIRKRSGML